MKILANLGKLRDGRNALILEKGNNIEYVLASAYNESAPEGEMWASGQYFSDITQFAKAITNANCTIGYERMNEIASKVIDGLREDDEYEAYTYCKNEVEMCEEELDWFGLYYVDLE